MTSFSLADIASVASVSVGLLAVLLLALQLYFSRRATRYDLEHQRVELEMMRKSIESKMYELNDRLMSTELRWRDVNHLLVSSQTRQPDARVKSAPIQLTPFLQASGVTQEDLAGDPRLVFILTPFHPNFRKSFEAIAEVCRSLDLTPMRGDEEAVQGEVFSHILRLLVRARLVVANIDGRNPNVLYELGLAHGLGKQTILVARKPEDVPFDVRAKRLVLYGSAAELQARLRDEIARSIVVSSRGEA